MIFQNWKFSNFSSFFGRSGNIADRRPFTEVTVEQRLMAHSLKFYRDICI